MNKKEKKKRKRKKGKIARSISSHKRERRLIDTKSSATRHFQSLAGENGRKEGIENRMHKGTCYTRTYRPGAGFDFENFDDGFEVNNKKSLQPKMQFFLHGNTIGPPLISKYYPSLCAAHVYLISNPRLRISAKHRVAFISVSFCSSLFAIQRYEPSVQNRIIKIRRIGRSSKTNLKFANISFLFISSC